MREEHPDHLCARHCWLRYHPSTHGGLLFPAEESAGQSHTYGMNLSPYLYAAHGSSQQCVAECLCLNRGRQSLTEQQTFHRTYCKQPHSNNRRYLSLYALELSRPTLGLLSFSISCKLLLVVCLSSYYGEFFFHTHKEKWRKSKNQSCKAYSVLYG